MAAVAAVSPDFTRIQQTLSLIDTILSALAAIFLAGVVIWMWGVRRRDPLADAPHRPHSLREDAIILAIMAYLTAGLVLSGVIKLATDQGDSVFARMIVGNGAHLIGISVCLAIAAVRFTGGLRGFCQGPVSVRPRLAGTTTAGMILLAVGLCPLIRDGTVSLILFFKPDYEFHSHLTIEWLHDPAQPMGVVMMLWIGAVVVAPVAEELFFRGLLQTFLVGFLPSRWLAISLASLAFGAIHLQQPYAIPALVVLAILIGYAYERTGSLIPPIAIHAAFNLKTLIWDALSGGSL